MICRMDVDMFFGVLIFDDCKTFKQATGTIIPLVYVGSI